MLGIERLKDAFEAAVPGYERGITVPAIVDVPTRCGGHQRLRPDHPRPVRREWTRVSPARAPRSCTPSTCATRSTRSTERGLPRRQQRRLRAGFAGTQESYEQAYERLFDRLDWLSDRLAGQRYLVGDTITEADVRLFTTLVRFDAVYHGHFKCNRSKLTEMPVLWAYARDLFQTPGFGDTIDFDHIKRHYYEVHRDINPTGIVPKGPDLGDWASAALPGGARRPARSATGRRPARRPPTSRSPPRTIRRCRYSTRRARR